MVDGWISLEEMKLVQDCMNIKSAGNLLEIGSANGRLLNYLYKSYPDWIYTAVDPWETEEVRLQLDWNKEYFHPGNLGDIITKEMFIKNCPFAETYQEYFENWKTNKKFDVISMGLVGKKVNWSLTYNKATNMLSPRGILIARNLNHKKYGTEIKNAIRENNLIQINQVGGSASYMRRISDE